MQYVNSPKKLNGTDRTQNDLVFQTPDNVFDTCIFS